MGWLPSFLGGENSSDPVRNLDPKLREFLEKESPVKYTTAEPSPAARPPPPPQTKHAQPSVAADGAAEPAVPSASLYKDGRYAHLWKTYRPLAQIEAETASDHDRLMNVLDGFKERKAAIGRTALENCALHQEEWVNCMKHGAWEDQLTMCRDKVRRFEKCYDMQARFLRTLGYGSQLDRPAEVDEDIQMHADALWQRMLAHQAAVKKAKDEGAPVPQFDPVVPRVAAEAAAFQPPEEVRAAWNEKLGKLPADERPAEEAALRAEYATKTRLARDVRSLRAAEQDERRRRREAGGEGFVDTLAALFGGGGKKS